MIIANEASACQNDISAKIFYMESFSCLSKEKFGICVTPLLNKSYVGIEDKMNRTGTAVAQRSIEFGCF